MEFCLIKVFIAESILHKNVIYIPLALAQVNQSQTTSISTCWKKFSTSPRILF